MRDCYFRLLVFALMALSWTSQGATSKRWNTLVLWSNEVLSANLKFMPRASLVDEDFMFVEFHNHTKKAVKVEQAWLGLPGTRVDQATQKSVFMGDMTGGVIYIGDLPPGVTRASQQGVFECGLANLGIPSKEGFHVELTPKGDARLADGRVFSISPDCGKAVFDWMYPTTDEMEAMKRRFMELLKNPKYEFAHGYRLLSLSRVKEVADTPSLDELLSARRPRENSVDGRASVVRIIGDRFRDDPRVVQLINGELEQGERATLDDLLVGSFWNVAWLPKILAGFQKTGDGTLLQILGNHRTDWASNESFIAELSTAFLNHRPLMCTDTTALGTNQLYSWCMNAWEARVIGSDRIIQILKPVLDDQRIAEDPNGQLSAAGPFKRRVCDVAFDVISRTRDAHLLSQARKELQSQDKTVDRNALYDLAIVILKRSLDADSGNDSEK